MPKDKLAATDRSWTDSPLPPEDTRPSITPAAYSDIVVPDWSGTTAAVPTPTIGPNIRITVARVREPLRQTAVCTLKLKADSLVCEGGTLKAVITIKNDSENPILDVWRIRLTSKKQFELSGPKIFYSIDTQKGRGDVNYKEGSFSEIAIPRWRTATIQLWIQGLGASTELNELVLIASFGSSCNQDEASATVMLVKFFEKAVLLNGSKGKRSVKVAVVPPELLNLVTFAIDPTKTGGNSVKSIETHPPYSTVFNLSLDLHPTAKAVTRLNAGIGSQTCASVDLFLNTGICGMTAEKRHAKFPCDLLASRYKPVIFLHKTEFSGPIDYEHMLDNSDLLSWNKAVPGQWVDKLVLEGPLKITRSEVKEKGGEKRSIDTRAIAGGEYFLRYKDEAFERDAHHKGVPTVYYRCACCDDTVVVQYWMFYPLSTLPTEDAMHPGVKGDWHQGDWEGMQVLLKYNYDTEELEPAAVTMFQHFYGMGFDWNDERLGRTGSRPHAFIAAGSHATYPGSAAYRTATGTPEKWSVGKGGTYQDFTTPIKEGSYEYRLKPLPEAVAYNDVQWGRHYESPPGPARRVQKDGKSLWTNPCEIHQQWLQPKK